MKRTYILTLLLAYLSVFSSEAQTTQLTVRGFSEGYYRHSMGRMVAVADSVNYPMICDTGFLQVIDTATGQAVFCTDVVIKTDGYGFCNVPAYLFRQYLRIAMKFRNSYHLLSKNVVRMTGNAVSVDLTVPQNVCCSFDTTYGVAKAYCGDMNDDGIFDGSDFLIIDGDFQSHNTGYLISDLTGDRVVDSLDINIFNKNFNEGYADEYVGACVVNDIDENEKNSMRMFPNPCRDFLSIEMDRSYEDVHVILYDCLGRIVMDESFFDGSLININTGSFDRGIYFLRLVADGREKFERKVILSN